MTIVVTVLLVVVAIGAYIALRNAQDFSDANEVVPGVDTDAPKEWAGAHSPEARLHRRLRDSMTAMRDNASLDDPAMQPIRASLEDQAVAIDRRLVAVAALPKARREAPMKQMTAAVDAVEEAVASLVMLRGPEVVDFEREIADVRARVGFVEAARAELEAMSTAPTDIEELRRKLEAEANAQAEPQAMPASPPTADPDHGVDPDVDPEATPDP